MSDDWREEGDAFDLILNDRRTGNLWESDDDDPGSDEWETPDDDGELESMWAEAYHLRRRLRELDAAESDGVFDPAAPDPAGLRRQLIELDLEMDFRGRPPAGWRPQRAIADEADVEPQPVGGPAPMSPFDAVLERELTPDELRHWRWILERRPQAEIRSLLGVSQPAVSKREGKLRAKVDALYRQHAGKPYPFLPIVAKRGGRPRRA